MKPDTNPPKALATKPGSTLNVKPDPKEDLKTLPLPEVEKKLGSSPEGLTQAEAQKRLTQYGPNELTEKKTNLFLKFLSYFWGPIPWMIEIAVILSGVVGHWPDFFIILLLLMANAVVGFWEEREASNAIEALKAKLAVKARVKRDGKWINPPARELVPGDVIRMRLGDIVPADARLLDGDPVEVDQSALTGESLPAERKSGDAVFSGSIIRQGEAGAMVYSTCATGAGSTYRQPLSKGGFENRQLPDHSCGGAGGGNHWFRNLSRRRHSHHAAICFGADCGRDSRGDADGAVGDDGGRRAAAGKETSYSEPVGGHRGVGRRGRAMRG
jgi:magnesium-transporting ATPase (P-type)